MRKVRKSRAAICREHGITAPTLAQWENEGINIHDPLAMSERAARKHGGGTGEMHAARLRKLKAEARTAEMKAAEMEGRLIDIAECEAAMTKISSITKALLLRFQADLPPLLYGMSAGEMQSKIADSVNAVLRQMSDPEGMPWREK